MNVAVIGARGFVGGELLRLLAGHPHVTRLAAFSRSAAGRAVGEVHPALASRPALRFEDAPPADAARGRDAVFLALEHGESTAVMDEVLSADPRVVCDLADDFRVGRPPFVYGLADVLGRELGGVRRIASPGCFATAAQIALRPLASAPLAAEPALFAVTGSSGAGARPKETTHHPLRDGNLFAYSVLSHRHQAEIDASWRRWSGRSGSPRLLAHAGPFVRGIALTLHARFTEPVDAIALARRSWAGRPFVRVLDEPPSLTHAVGTNLALVHAASSPDGLEAQIEVAIDNLIKGAGGQAVQAVNLSLGFPEEAGLDHAPSFP